MENHTLKHLSQVEICRRMATLCRQSAKETPPGPEQERMADRVCYKFSFEADDLAIQDLQRAKSGH